MDQLSEPRLRHLLHRVKRWEISVDRAFDELVELLAREVRPSESDTPAPSLPGPRMVGLDDFGAVDPSAFVMDSGAARPQV